MAWNQPGGQNNPWGRRPPREDGGIDRTLRDFQRRLESFIPGGGEGSALLWLALAALVAWGFSGFYQISAAERGVITRFGKFVDTRGPGLGWHLPWPIESVAKVNVSNVNSVEYKSRVLTADVNLVDLSLGVQYQFSDPVKALFAVRDPESSLREVSESAIREIVGRSDLEGVLVSNRQQVTERTMDLIQRTLDFYGTGIRVTSVNLTDVQVPEAVVPSQRDANKAIADRDRLVKEAEAYQSGILPVAEGAAARQLQEAEAYRAQVVAVAEGEAARFSQLARAYADAPNVTRQRLYIDTVENVLKSSDRVVLDASEGDGKVIYLPLDRLFDRDARDGQAVAPLTVPSPDTEQVTVEGRSRGER
jgi:membrane protease subunit HflK